MSSTPSPESLNAKLLPCPQCGGEGSWGKNDYRLIFIECKRCGYNINSFSFRSHAFLDWNNQRRSSQPAVEEPCLARQLHEQSRQIFDLQAEVERLRKENGELKSENYSLVSREYKIPQEVEEIEKLEAKLAQSEKDYDAQVDYIEELQATLDHAQEALKYAIKAFENNWELSETLEIMEKSLAHTNGSLPSAETGDCLPKATIKESLKVQPSPAVKADVPSIEKEIDRINHEKNVLRNALSLEQAEVDKLRSSLDAAREALSMAVEKYLRHIKIDWDDEKAILAVFTTAQTNPSPTPTRETDVPSPTVKCEHQIKDLRCILCGQVWIEAEPSCAAEEVQQSKQSEQPNAERALRFIAENNMKLDAEHLSKFAKIALHEMKEQSGADKRSEKV